MLPLSYLRFACRSSRSLQPSCRFITTFSAQQKLQERTSRGSDFLADKPEKLKFREEARQQQRPDHLNQATSKLKSHSKCGEYEEGWALFKSISDADLNLKNAALHLCARANWRDRAWELWGDMAKGSLEAKNEISYNTMLDVCARSKQADRAERVFEEMKQAGVEPNVISYNSLVNAHAMCGNLDAALRAFASIPPELFKNSSLQNKKVAFQAVMTACARAADYAKCREVFIQMTEAGVPPDRGHFSALLAACAHGKHGDIAQAIFNQMPAYGVVPDVANWTILISCHTNNLPRCKELVEEMKLSSIEPSGLMCQELLEAHVVAQDGPGARQILDSGKLGEWQRSGKVARLRDAAQALP